ncbi:transposase [Streptomyces sp. URMC 126]|uniref:transposase n=1 Tax=Streptomyces sp. URMC 126 TaxID=3423401 RepID=UPI003F19B457
MQIVTAQRRELIEVFTGLRPRRFHRLVRAVHREGGRALAPDRPGRPWALTLEDRVLLVAMYCRTNLTVRPLAPLFGISPVAVDRTISWHGPLLALTPGKRKPGRHQVLIVGGTLVPTRDRTLSASSKNYRFSANLQVLITAETRLVLGVGRPLPGNRNDCIAFAESRIKDACGSATVIADGGYQGTDILMSHRRQAGQDRLPDWKGQHNASHCQVRARFEPAFVRVKNWTILRDCRLKGDGVYWTTSGVAHMHNLALGRA